MRSSLIVEKLGTTSMFTDEGNKLQVTLLKLQDCEVVSHKTGTKDNYEAVVVGYGSSKTKKLKKPQKEFYAKSKIEPKRYMKEFKVSNDNLIPVGEKLSVDHFRVGQYIDAQSISKGKGFAGAMKRHNFSGLEMTHGVSASHRAHGSTGQCQDPGKVFKGKKMAGRMGAAKVSLQNLQIVNVEKDNNIIIVKGSVPGPKGGIVYLKDAIKK